MRKGTYSSWKWIGVAGIATLWASSAAAQAVVNTKHDLRTASTGATVKEDASATISNACTFCHTPHNTTGDSPLWNVNDPSSLGFNSLTTLSGVSLPGTLMAASKACLTCHDGTADVAQASPTIDLNNKAIDPGLTGSMGSNVKLEYGGTDLNKNHPVSIPYADETGAYNGITRSAALTGYATPDASNKIAGTFKLYDAGGGVWGMECGTCHDPHTNTNAPFLRATNNAAFCTTCHTDKN